MKDGVHDSNTRIYTCTRLAFSAKIMDTSQKQKFLNEQLDIHVHVHDVLLIAHLLSEAIPAAGRRTGEGGTPVSWNKAH